jgi:hypothetical protein
LGTGADNIDINITPAGTGDVVINKTISNYAYGGLQIRNDAYNGFGRTSVTFYNSNASADYATARISSEIGNSGVNPYLMFESADGSEVMKNRIKINKTGRVTIFNSITIGSVSYAYGTDDEGLHINNYCLSGGDAFRRMTDFAAVGEQDGTNGGSVIRFLTNPKNANALQTRLSIGQDGLIAVGELSGSYPALKRSGTELQIRLADDSGYSSIKVNDLYHDGQSAHSISMARHTTSDTAGNNLTVQAGGATSGSTNKAGGYLDLVGGISTGTGSSGVRIKGYVSGSSGTSDNSTSTVIEVLGNKLGFFGSTPVDSQSAQSITCSQALTASYALTSSYAFSYSGTSGTSGTSGAAGTSGTSGTSGAAGTSGTSGTSGTGFTTIYTPSDYRILTATGSSTSSAVAQSSFTFNSSTSVLGLTGSFIISSNPTGSDVFTIYGSSGQLFNINDSLSGSLFSVNDISGLPILEAFSDNTVLLGNYLAPVLNTTNKVTTTNSGSFTICSFSTASYDGIFMEYTAKSASNARAGQFMSIWSGSSVNYVDNSTTDFGDTSNLSFTGSISGSNIVITGNVTTGSGWVVKSIIRTI